MYLYLIENGVFVFEFWGKSVFDSSPAWPCNTRNKPCINTKDLILRTFESLKVTRFFTDSSYIGLKRYAQPTIQYDTRYDAHDTIRSAIHLPFLLGKQRLDIPACDQKHCAPPTTTACAVMMRSGYNNGGLLGVSRCSVFVMNMMNSLILLEYTDCFLWYLVFVSNFGMCYICTGSYRPQSVSRYVP